MHSVKVMLGYNQEKNKKSKLWDEFYQLEGKQWEEMSRLAYSTIVHREGVNEFSVEFNTTHNNEDFDDTDNTLLFRSNQNDTGLSGITDRNNIN